MKNFISMLVAFVVSMGMNAQLVNTMTVMKGNTIIAVYTAEQADRVVFQEDDFLPGEFSVSGSKKVKFTKSNIYWDGTDFKFEDKQTDYQTDWDPNHVSHFYWTKSQEASYAQDYNDGTISTSDVPFFAESKGGLTVDGTPGLYALTYDEWKYLISTRTNATNLRKYDVTVGESTNCLIIAPDGFSGTLKSSYTLDEINSLGLVCLPAAGRYINSSFSNGGSYGYYWSSTPIPSYSDYASYLNFGLSNVEFYTDRRDRGFSLRLVGSVQ